MQNNSNDSLSQADTINLTTPEDIDYVYKALLERNAEPAALKARIPVIDFIVGVATSDERNRLVESKLRQNLKYDIVKTDDGFMIIDTRDKVIGKSFKNTGSFAEKDIDALLNALFIANVTVTKTIFLDVGANIGGHTIHALRQGFEKAICLEPDNDNFSLLRANQILNGLDCRCQNICAAASIETGVSIMEQSPSNFGDHRIKARHIHGPDIHSEYNWDTTEVETVTLDDVFNEYRLDQVGLAWIDTQGHEGHVLKGAKKLLGSGSPIVLEFWPYGLTRSGGWPMLLETLRSSNKSIFDVKTSIANNMLAPLQITDIERLFDDLLNDENKHNSAHTDLLLL